MLIDVIWESDLFCKINVLVVLENERKKFKDICKILIKFESEEFREIVNGF